MNYIKRQKVQVQLLCKKGTSFIFMKNIFSNVLIDSWWGNNTQAKFYWQKSDIRNASFGKFLSKPISGTLNRGQATRNVISPEHKEIILNISPGVIIKKKKM